MTALTKVLEIDGRGTRRVVYEMDSTRVTVEGLAFDYIAVSRGRLGDTCAFPAQKDGALLDFLGIGYEMGPGWHLLDEELEAYALECLSLHDEGATKDWYVLAGGAE